MILEKSFIIISFLATIVSAIVARFAVIKCVDVETYAERFKNHIEWFDRVKMHEERMLKLQRHRFMIRAFLFLVFVVGSVVFRMYPLNVVLLVVWCVAVGAWVCDAYVTSSESFVYKDYVCYIYPHVNGGSRLKLTPTRGFFSCLLMSWNVTLYYMPFLLLIPLLLLSSNRVKMMIDKRPYDERVLEHLLVRQNEYIANQQNPLYHIKECIWETDMCERTNKVVEATNGVLRCVK